MARRENYSITQLKVKGMDEILLDDGISFGVDADGIDVKLYGATASAYALWDESADMMIFEGADLKVNDGDFILFGDATAGDVQMNWDSSHFICAPVTGFWAGCPTTAYPDPSQAYTFMEDFIGFPVSATAKPDIGWTWYEDTLATFVEAAGSLGGVMCMTTAATVDDSCGIQLGNEGTETYIEYTKSSGKKSWVEFRVRIKAHADNQSIFIGLAEEGANADSFIADAGDDVADKDLVGFIVWEAAGEVVDVIHQKAAGTFRDVCEAVTDHADAWHTYGIYFDGTETVSYYVDGTVLGTTSDLDTTTFPSGEELSPLIHAKVHSGSAIAVSIDWIKFVVER